MTVLSIPAAAAINDRAVHRVPGRRIDLLGNGDRGTWLDIPVEVPVSLVYGRPPFEFPYAVMLASPCDLEDFMVGFSLTEGVVQAADEVRSVVVETVTEGILVTAEIAGDPMRRQLRRRRAHAGRTSCGWCGKEELGDLPRVSAPQGPRPSVDGRRVAAMLAALDAHQPLHACTRAVHGAAWFDADGRLVAVREDVGRHNALDKLIGALTRGGVRPDGGGVAITSRCSVEMIEKAAVYGARLVVAVSAPTSLAIRRAEALGITLVAVARRDAAILFTGGAEALLSLPADHR